MKRFLLLPLLMLVMAANAKTYYVSAAGNDANAGTSSTTAWKTLTKVNSFTFAANDSILFKRGDVFYGSVIINRNNLTFSAYGTGAKPLISGFTTITSWKSLGGGIYEAVVNAKSTLNMVTINGKPQQIGRYPNAGDANGGYLTFESSGSTSITDAQLSSTVNWTGADVAIRKNDWTLERLIVTSQSAGGTINYRLGRGINSSTTPNLSTAKNNSGYFFMNDLRTLDQFGEWYFDTTAKKIKIYFGSDAPANYTIRVSTVDTLFYIGSRTNININNFYLEGANRSAIFADGSGYLNIQNCDMVNTGAKALHIYDSPNILVENVTTYNSLSNGIVIVNRRQPNVTVRNCIVKRSGQITGMGSFLDGYDYRGMQLIVSNNLLAEYNVVDTAGLAGIYFQGNDIILRNNVVNHFCTTLQDNGGIYTWVGGTDVNPGTTYTNRTISNNIVMNGVGAPFGTASGKIDFAAIFMDDRSMNVKILDNTVFNCDRAIQCNTPAGITVRGNVLYNNKKDITIVHKAEGTISNLTVTKNVSFPMNADQVNFIYNDLGMDYPVARTLEQTLKSIGKIDSNYYNTFSGTGILTEIHESKDSPLMPSSPYSLEGWRLASNHDLVTKRPAQKIQPYSITSTVSSNLFTNGQFTSNINGVTVWGDATTAAWDNTGKISGGAIRVNFTKPVANKFSLLYGAVGPVSSSKKYILRFSTLGTKPNGIVKALIRKTVSPYNELVAEQIKTFGTAKTSHEFLFEAPITESNASFQIDVEQNSGTTYIDNIEFFEVTATVNTVESQVKFLYNDTKLSKSITLDAKYIGVDSTVYNGVITLAPYSSRVIVKAGPVSGTLPVKLIEFTAKNISDKVEVKWVTTGEVNSSHYLVERSADGRQFESITSITSNNRADIQSTYSFNDNMPMSGVVYYRLAMVDKDGSVAYSRIVSITVKNTNTKLFVIDNIKVSASASNVRINISTYQEQSLSFAVVDVSGRVVVSKNIQLQSGRNSIVTDIPAINKGIYYVKMQTADALLTRAVLSE